jgi:putative heme-binding domain-containing protein
VPEPLLLGDLLESPDARARAAAVRVLRHWAGRIGDPLALLEPRVEDDHPRVRLEAVRALGRIPGVRSAELAMRALDRPVDRFLDYALWLTARDLAPSWLPAVQAGAFDFGGKPAHLLFALNAVGSPAVVGPLVEVLRSGRVPAAQRGRVLALIGALGGPDDLAVVLDAALAGGDPDGRAALLRTLGDATRRRKVRPAGDLARVLALLEAPEPALRAAAARAAGLWGLAAAGPRLYELARAPGATDAERLAMVEALASLGAIGRPVLESLAAAPPTPLRREAIVALAGLDPPAAARRAVPALEEVGSEDAAPIFEAFLGRQGGAEALQAALAGGRLPADVAKVGVRLARGSGAERPELVAAIARAGGLSDRPTLPTAAERQAILAEVAAHGDPARGEAVFRRKDSACLNCHAVAGAGGQVGPSLESIGASAPVDYLLDAILEPNKAIKENYHSLVVATSDGRIVNGIALRQGGDTLVLRDAEDREIAIPAADIEEQKTGGSLMPAGQADALTRAELVDLVAFLAALGKPGAYAIGPERVARRWRVLDPPAESLRELQRLGAIAAVRDDPSFPWRPFYATVAGTLPRGELPAYPPNFGGAPISLVRTQVEVTQPGPVVIAAAAPAGAFEAWLDGVQVEAAAAMTLDLAPGLHTLTFALRRDALPADFRCELRDAPGSPARARFVVGK